MDNRYNHAVKGFLHTDGRRMVNEDNETVILRGWGTGNWMNPEGFMVGGTRPFNGEYNQPKKLDRARSMDLLIRELCGTEYAKNFWPQWYRHHLGERDIQAMAELGYNCVRLVLNAAALLKEEPGYQWNEDTFEHLDDVISWCEKYRIYAILDMHTAPGGQSCGGCDDAVDNVPHLFIDEESRERAIRLWEKLAERYKDRWIIGGYDLLNEPLNNPPAVAQYEELLKDYYTELIPRIRAIDKNHMLTVESTIWSTQVSVFDRNWDPECNNWCIHTHIYGFSSELQELSAMLERSLELNVPIWIGEGGADNINNSVFLQIAETQNIGYCLWCWKAAYKDAPMPGREINPAAHHLPKDWNLVFDYADHGGPRPGYEKSQQIFNEYLENLDYDRCEHPATRHQYLLRQPGITLPAVGYDGGVFGETFHGTWHLGNAYQYREADHMRMIVKPDGERPGPKAVWGFAGKSFPNPPKPMSNLWLVLREGEFVHYTINDVKDTCKVTLSALSADHGALKVTVNNQSKVLALSETLSSLDLFELPQGSSFTICVECTQGSCTLSEITFA